MRQLRPSEQNKNENGRKAVVGANLISSGDKWRNVARAASLKSAAKAAITRGQHFGSLPLGIRS
jgi:hypothetical protein